MRQVRLVMYRHSIDMHSPRLHLPRHLQALSDLSPNTRTETDLHVIGDADGVIGVLCADDDERGAKGFFVVDFVVGGDVGEDGRGKRGGAVLGCGFRGAELPGSLLCYIPSSDRNVVRVGRG